MYEKGVLNCRYRKGKLVTRYQAGKGEEGEERKYEQVNIREKKHNEKIKMGIKKIKEYLGMIMTKMRKHY